MLPVSLYNLGAALCESGGRLRVGLDVVDVNQVRGSLQQFGRRYLSRLFTEDEIGYALQAREQCAERLAARFAAKEAAIKAFSLSEVGVSWRDIEVRKQPDGGCRLALHGKAARAAVRLGVSDIALSLSHDGDYAGAVVTALCAAAAVESVSESN
jgi:holo-[acyl-carrier protein] synthase